MSETWLSGMTQTCNEAESLSTISVKYQFLVGACVKPNLDLSHCVNFVCLGLELLTPAPSRSILRGQRGVL